MHVVMPRRCGDCLFRGENLTCLHPKAPDGLESPVYYWRDPMPAECPLRRWSVLVQAAEAPSAREHEPKQSIDVEPPREPLVTQEERDAAMDKALSCLVEDLAQWREERPTEERERACCDLHSAKEEG